jgi:nicotine blue oxidoreductase
VLAAGGGRRFGLPKALVRYDGDLLVDRAVRAMRDGGCSPVVVVLGAAAGDVVAAATLDEAVVVVNDGWAEGMGSSLRCGLAALGDLGVPAVVVGLVDQPLVGAAVVRRLCEHWQPGGGAVVASYDGRPRNPVSRPRRPETWVPGTGCGHILTRSSRSPATISAARSTSTPLMT